MFRASLLSTDGRVTVTDSTGPALSTWDLSSCLYSLSPVLPLLTLLWYLVLQEKLSTSGQIIVKYLSLSLVKFKINKDQKLFRSFKRNCRWYIIFWTGREKLWIRKRGWGMEDLLEIKWKENKAEWLSHDHRLYDTSLGNNTLPSLCNWPLHYQPQ